jgi:hypothetical protein
MQNTLYISLAVTNHSYFDAYDHNKLRFTADIDFRLGSLLNGYDKLLPEGANTYTPAQGDKYYFLPGVSIPRVKLKNLTKDYKIKVVREITEATHVFYGKKSEDKLTDYKWDYHISTNNFKAFYEDAKAYMDTYDINRIDAALEFYTNDKILTDYNTLINLCKSSKLPFQTEFPDLFNSNSSSRFVFVKEDHKEVYPHIAGAPLYKEEALLLHLNGEEAVEIDEKMFIALGEMFSSSDKDNHTLAMEIMANSHFEKSLLYLELLFTEYSAVMTNCKTRHHVNFKSLVSFLNKGNYYGTSIDDVIKSLIKHDQLSINYLNIILNKYSDQIKDAGDTQFFTVKSISVSPELLEKMNTNYEYIVQENIEVIEIQEEPLVIEETIAETPEEMAIVPEKIKEIPVANEDPDFFL